MIGPARPWASGADRDWLERTWRIGCKVPDGSDHFRFDEREFLNLPVPRALITDQATYKTTVRQMVTPRQRAIRLLEAAKRAVEIAIVDSEAAALAHLAAANPADAAA